MLILPAHAKLNLALEVVSRRDDGLHDIDSIVVLIDWHDLVGIAFAPAPEISVRLRVTGSSAVGVPTDASNLCVRAATELLALAPAALRADLWLEKRVPHAAGLGGGSADAAAVLRAGGALLARAGTTVTEAALQRIAVRLGSDVPVMLSGGAQRVRGHGDVLTPLDVPRLHVAVVMAAPSATRASFAALLAHEVQPDGRAGRLAESMRRGSPDQTLFGSALESASGRANPALQRALITARSVTPERTWHMTGSGGALFTVAADGPEAESLAMRMAAAGFPARAARTLPGRDTV